MSLFGAFSLVALAAVGIVMAYESAPSVQQDRWNVVQFVSGVAVLTFVAWALVSMP